MDAVHLMRAITGRDLIIKVEGCYHGHHDSVQVSVAPEADEAGPEGKPAQIPASTGIPGAFVKLTLVASFNDTRQRRPAAGRAPGRDRRDDHRADHDERRDHPPRARLPGGAEGPAALPRRPAHLRRGQDRPDGGPGRRHRADRRGARHHLPGQGDRRRGRDRRHRRLGRGDGARRGRRLRDGRHVQRQPARAGRRPRHAHARSPPPEAYQRIDALARAGRRRASSGRSPRPGWPRTW